MAQFQGRRILTLIALAVLGLLLYSTLSSHPRTSAYVAQRWGQSTESSTSPSSNDPNLKDQFTTPHIVSTFMHDPTNSLAFRNHLELTTSPETQIKHSPTMTFDHIYVLSLPNRSDRREQMLELAKAHGLKIVFVDAVSKDLVFIKWIAERASEIRKERLKLIAAAKDVDIDSIGGLHVGNDWLTPTPSGTSEDEFPSLAGTDPRWLPDDDWVQYLERHDREGKLNKLVPKQRNLNVTEILWDQNEKIDGRQVNEGVISTFWGHTRAMQLMIKNGDESALFLEDDVDFEWDLERIWARIEKSLPNTWDSTFLGHCWGRELLRPAYRHPLLHPSVQPLCLHGYALSRQGVKRVLSLLNNPWTAYQTAVDTAVPSFIFFRLLTSFSVEPPIITQRKDGPSDIQEGVGSVWKGLLMDSTVERIARSKGEEWPEEVYDEDNLDPATVYRYGKKCIGVGG
ncbi:BZ3500_MvSof-1268-A1-R1_Chr11-1g03228 [Microbotryum saponariae]|uniref:BZ3500_MvSof-1268-A1-R1_Chr11-1g03228 protein n=1 Tax=Microbotryum saponariae TaxID=289078 RepID=A0A2X0LFS5_9BASI|nr:BZ3501_MvSof-1269-A2-R1_Chr11g02803 [Microbotryum saponariae]SDA03788.1 BZ3500_MvSof-1268-A1-R1_Chr11-1g03228 [Microbotryum saponariae]